MASKKAFDYMQQFDGVRNVNIEVGAVQFHHEFRMSIPVPISRDPEEYIDELLDNILSPKILRHVEWDFVGNWHD